MISIVFFLVSFLLNSVSVLANPLDSLDANYFRVPVNHKVAITGSFGELRTNHYHAGIDFRSSHSGTPDSLFAAAEGVIRRIKVQSGSYGQSLYIEHPNGFTTVYAHLHQYAPRIAYHLKKKQYELELAHIDYYLDSTDIKVEKGEFIGFMGNTGRSSGPHLHFEIRHTDTEVPVNPYLFNLKPNDSKDPILKSVHIHRLAKDGSFLSRKFIGTKSKKSYLTSHSDTLNIKSDFIGFAIGTFDQMDGLPNLNGTYRMLMTVDDSLTFDYKLDEISFDETRYINAAIDYDYKKKIGNSVIKLYSTPGNQLGLYRNNDFSGNIKLAKKAKKVNIILQDFEGNETELLFYVAKDSSGKNEASKSGNIRFDTTQLLKNGSLSLSIPPESFDQNINMTMYRQERSKLVIGDASIPVFKYLSFKAVDNQLSEKSFIGKYSSSGRVSNCGGFIRGDTISTEIKEFGIYGIFEDEKAPVVSKIKMQKKGKWLFSLKDNYGTRSICPEIKIECSIDGKWIRHYYDEKNDRIEIIDADLVPSGAKELQILVSDPLKNQQIYSFKI